MSQLAGEILKEFRFIKSLDYADERIRTFVSTKLTALEAVPFDHSGTPADENNTNQLYKKL